MNLKILCTCGTKFSFEVEPVDGKMPADIFCPACGMDVTELGNVALEKTLSENPPAAPEPSASKPRVRLHVATPASHPGNDANAAESSAPGVEVCHRHPRKAATHHCVVCQKPICPECMQSFGYLCSVNCRYRADQEKIRVPVYKLQRNVAERGGMQKAMALTGVVALLLCALAGAWMWYIFSGSKPRTFYTLELPAGTATYAQFLGPERILLIRKNEVALHDIKTKKDLWVTALEDPNPAREIPQASVTTRKPLAVEEADSEDFYEDSSSRTEPFFNGDDLWLALTHRVVCVDLKTGSLKYTVPFRGRLDAFTPGDSNLLLVSDLTSEKKVVTQIALDSGEAKVSEITTPFRERVALSKEPPSNVLPTASLLMKYEVEGAEKQKPSLFKSSTEYFPAGETLVEMQVKLVEIKITSVQTMKKAGPSNLGTETTASTSARAVLEEITNEMKRNSGGGVRNVDESRYAVTLRRPTEPGPVDWSSEVISLPVFFPQKSVNLLAAGKMLYVFDKQNKKIAESQLQYPVDDRYTSPFGFSGEPPAIEANDSLYFFDKGVLTAFDLPSCSVRWRLPSVGVHRIQFDGKGILYVSTTTASPEDIQYSEQIKIGDGARPLVLKVDPKTGKTLWKTEQIGDHSFLTGKYLYMTDAFRGGFAMANAVQDAFGAKPDSGTVSIYRVDPANGKEMWTFTRAGEPSGIDFAANRILLHEGGRIEILKFLSF